MVNNSNAAPRTRQSSDTQPTRDNNRPLVQVLLNSDPHISGRQGMLEHLETVVTKALGHYGTRITRVEAHLSDANGASKTGPDDIHCTLEARPDWRGPVVVKDRAGSAHQAIDGALRKLERALATAFEKHDTHHVQSQPTPETDD